MLNFSSEYGQICIDFEEISWVFCSNKDFGGAVVPEVRPGVVLVDVELLMSVETDVNFSTLSRNFGGKNKIFVKIKTNLMFFCDFHQKFAPKFMSNEAFVADGAFDAFGDFSESVPRNILMNGQSCQLIIARQKLLQLVAILRRERAKIGCEIRNNLFENQDFVDSRKNSV